MKYEIPDVERVREAAAEHRLFLPTAGPNEEWITVIKEQVAENLGVVAFWAEHCVHAGQLAVLHELSCRCPSILPTLEKRAAAFNLGHFLHHFKCERCKMIDMVAEAARGLRRDERPDPPPDSSSLRMRFP